MPIDDTPFEQVVVALATKCTGDAAEEPEIGAVTFTVANVGMAEMAIRINSCFIEILQLRMICTRMLSR
jgi:hypothetical protein